MVILVNYESQPFKIQYRSDNRVFSKQIPKNAIVAMKGLSSLSQIVNHKFLTKKSITIYHYESEKYLNQYRTVPTDGSLPYLFVGNNTKPASLSATASGYSGTTTQSRMTISADNLATSTLFGFITSGSTGNTQASTATTIGNNFYIDYNTLSAATTTDWYGAVSAYTVSAGIDVTGYGFTLLTDDTTFYLSATTSDPTSGFVYLQNLV